MKTALVLLLAAAFIPGPPVNAQGSPHPDCFQNSLGAYVEGTLPLASLALLTPGQAPEVPKACQPHPSKVTSFPPEVMMDVSDANQLRVFVRQPDSTGS